MDYFEKHNFALPAYMLQGEADHWWQLVQRT